MSVALQPAADTEQPAASTDWVLELEFDAHGRLGAPRGGMPLAAATGSRAFLSGFLYDRRELAARVGLAPTASDAELALAEYARSGEEGLSALRGSFALVIADQAHRRIIATRDPLGFHPLFFAEAPGRLLFGASPLPLVRRPGVSRDLNRAAMADHLCHRWPDRQETFFAAVRRVPPGWMVTAVSGRTEVRRYWHPAPDGQPIEFTDAQEGSRFEEVFDRAVDRCLSTGRPGIFLSGGLDSISVAAVAADRARRRGSAPPWALSLAFPHPDCDERAVQSSVAQALGLPFELLDFEAAAGPDGLLRPALALNAGAPAPILNPWTPAYDALARVGRRHGVETVLTGSGGDEWLGVSPFLAADLIRRGRVGDVARLAAMWHRSFRQTWPRALRNTLWTFGLRPLSGMWLDAVAPRLWQRSRSRRLRRQDPDWVAPSMELRVEQQRRAVAALPPARPAEGFYTRESRTCLDNTLVSWEREEQFHFDRHTGVRLLAPFWDADLLAFVYRLPPSVLTRGHRSKALVRDVVSRRFPSLGLERQRKVTAVSYFRGLLARELPAIARSLGNLSALASLGVIDARGAMAAVDAATRHDDGRSIRELHLVWELLNLETWARLNIG